MPGKNREELLRQITFEEPVHPRRLNSAIPADLETIVLKAMAKEPQERYLAAQELADDLRRFLDNRPILAKRPSILEHAAKWSRRHKHVVYSAVVLLLMAVVGLTLSNVLIAAAYDAEAEQRALAEKNFQQAREMLDFFMQFSEIELAARPDTEDLRRRLLEAGHDYYGDFIKQNRNNRPLQEELAASQAQVARILNEIGSEPDAFAAFERAFAFQEQLVRDYPRSHEFRNMLYSIYRELVVEPGERRLKRVLNQAVQKDLQVAKTQAAGILQLDLQAKRRDSRDDFDEFKTMSRAERKQEFERRSQQTNESLTRILTSQQVKRLEQISVQLQRSRAFTSSEVVVKLGITNEQNAEIRNMRDEVRRSMRRYYRSGDRQKASEGYRKLTDRILDVLSPEQREKWNGLRGKPFDIDEYYRCRPSRRYSSSRRNSA